MMNKKGMATLVVAAVVAVGAAYVSLEQDRTETGQPQQPLFPDLLARANDVSKILIKKPDQTTTLVRQEDGWVVSEKDGYPAVASKVRELVLGLAQSQRVERKTKNPERYVRLGVEGLDSPESGSTLMQLLDAQDNTLAAAIVGKSQRSPAAAELSSYYVRLVDDPQSWLVEGGLPPLQSVEDWLDKKLLDFGDERIRRVEVQHADGERVQVSRDKPDDQDFKLEGLAADEEIESQYQVNNVANTWKRLAMDDVEKDQQQSLPADGVTRITVETFDGIRVSAALAKDGDRVKARLGASYDETVAAASDEADTQATDQVTSGGGDQEDVLSPAQQAEALAQKWKDWVFVIPDYQFSNIAAKKSELLKQARDTAATDESGESSASQN